MTTSPQKRPLASIILIVLVVFLGIGAVPAGSSLLLDPSGAGLGMSTDALQPIYFVLGLMIMILCLLPSVRAYYSTAT